MKDNCFFLEAFKGIRGQSIDIVRMPTYGPTSMTIAEANSLPWALFTKKIKPFASVTSSDQITEFIAVPKDVNWTTLDLAIFAGELTDDGSKPIVEFTDLSPQASVDMFTLHFNTAQELEAREHKLIQFTFGYNPLDYTPGHHSLRRFHTHFRSLGNQLDQQFVETVDWEKTDWFERLTLVEPFSTLYEDAFAHILSHGEFSEMNPRNLRSQKGGYISVDLNIPKDMDLFSLQFRNLYNQLKTHFTEVESIFTDQKVDVQTGRYLPVSLTVRTERLSDYLQDEGSFLSEQSVAILHYLAKNLKPAAMRKTPAGITSSGEAWITKGFAGGFSFTTKTDSDQIRMDFFPRIITTTGPTKNLFGDGHCLGFKKTTQLAPQEAIENNIKFREEVKSIFGNQIIK